MGVNGEDFKNLQDHDQHRPSVVARVQNGKKKALQRLFLAVLDPGNDRRPMLVVVLHILEILKILALSAQSVRRVGITKSRRKTK